MVFLNNLNSFFGGRFEALNGTLEKKVVPHQDEKALHLDITDVRKEAEDSQEGQHTEDTRP